jgi:hypothetical protein
MGGVGIEPTTLGFKSPAGVAATECTWLQNAEANASTPRDQRAGLTLEQEPVVGDPRERALARPSRKERAHLMALHDQKRKLPTRRR